MAGLLTLSYKSTDEKHHIFIINNSHNVKTSDYISLKSKFYYGYENNSIVNCDKNIITGNNVEFIDDFIGGFISFSSKINKFAKIIKIIDKKTLIIDRELTIKESIFCIHYPIKSKELFFKLKGSGDEVEIDINNTIITNYIIKYNKNAKDDLNKIKVLPLFLYIF